MMASAIPSLTQLLNDDLDYICESLQDEFRQLSGKNLLITGGAGFLGYYLVLSALHWNRKAAAQAPIRITVYDSHIRGVPSWLAALSADPNLMLVRHDVRNPLPTGIGDFHYIVHAAGIASPIYYRKQPIETIDANINGLRYLFDYALGQKKKGVPVEGFLFYSSSEIYGDPDSAHIPTPEDYRGNVSCTGPRACYDESKRFGETLCVVYSQQHGLPVKTARPFNNYGPGLKITDRRVLPDFARDILSGRDIVMFSDGSPTRTFCYSADAIVGYYKVLVKGLSGEAYNIGIERPEISIAQFADKIVAIAADLFDYRGKVVRHASPESDYLVDNPNRRCPVIGKARSHLGFEPTILVDEGLRRSLIWYYHNQEATEA
jgi:nucleoside-diphosphate-sugar epimerase